MWSQYKQAYRVEWEQDEELKNWISRASDPSKAFCRYCKCNINAHLSSLQKHCKTNKHLSVVQSMGGSDNLKTIAQVTSNRADHDISPTELQMSAKKGDSPKKGNSAKKSYKQHFKDAWLEHEDLKDWLVKLPDDNDYAYCKICKKKIRAHLTDLRKHKTTVKHTKNVLKKSAGNEIDSDEDMIELPDYPFEVKSPSKKRKSSRKSILSSKAKAAVDLDDDDDDTDDYDNDDDDVDAGDSFDEDFSSGTPKLSKHISTDRILKAAKKFVSIKKANTGKSIKEEASDDETDVMEVSFSPSKSKANDQSLCAEPKRTFIWPKVILLGDALTQYSFSEEGWGTMLTDMLQRKCDVLNRGFTGYNSRMAAYMLPRLFPRNFSACEVAAVIVFIGADDSNVAGSHQHVPVSEYGENLETIINYLRGIGVSKRKIILMGPPPCETVVWKKLCNSRGTEMNKDADIIPEYNEQCRKVANKCGAQFVDIYTAMITAENWPSYLEDGYHLSREGSRLLFDYLMPRLAELTVTLPQMLPDWRSLDPLHPGKSVDAF